MLKLDAVDTFYGPSQALFGMELTIGEGEVVTLMGRNGMGKTTTVNTIMGIAPAAGGRVLLDGAEIQALPSHRIARLGIGTNIGRRADRDHPAIDQHRNAVGERKNRVHVVLDQDHRDRPLEFPEERDHAVGFLRPHAGHRLVEEQGFGLGGHGHGDLQLTVFAMGHRGGRHSGPVGQAEPFQYFHRRVCQ